jgi:hypothetical protein
VPVVFGPAEQAQRALGGSNPRFGSVFDSPADKATSSTSGGDRGACVVVAHDQSLAAGIDSALGTWGLTGVGIGPFQPFDRGASEVPQGFDAVHELLERLGTTRHLDALVVALAGPGDFPESGPPWQRVIDDHRQVSDHVLAHAAWLRAASLYAQRSGNPLRVVFVTTALTPAGRTAAQAMAQMARSANDTPDTDTVPVFNVALETDDPRDHIAVGHLLARLARADDTKALRGAELVVQRGWIGLRTHPGPVSTVSFGGPAIPDWVPEALRNSLQF